MKPASIPDLLLAYANQLKFRNLFFLVAGLFFVDILVPDFIPMIDEIILGVLAILLANWKKDRAQKKPGTLIDGEVIDNNEKQ